jgi:hypothetical protein
MLSARTRSIPLRYIDARCPCVQIHAHTHAHARTHARTTGQQGWMGTRAGGRARLGQVRAGDVRAVLRARVLLEGAALGAAVQQGGACECNTPTDDPNKGPNTAKRGPEISLKELRWARQDQEEAHTASQLITPWRMRAYANSCTVASLHSSVSPGCERACVRACVRACLPACLPKCARACVFVRSVCIRTCVCRSVCALKAVVAIKADDATYDT